MDNLTHTLAGALLAECGLKERSRLAYPALLMGANLPDIDIVSVAFGGLAALGFRRGWTHGIVAMAILPFVLAGILMAWEGIRRRRVDLRALADRRRPSFGALAAVSAVAILSHPLLDLLNNYGVRLLMPFSDRWFYGDSAFIVDPWMLVLLMGGVALGRREARGGGANVRPARAALALLLVYIALMARISRSAERALAAAAGVIGPISPRTLMVAPEPVSITTRTGLVDVGDAYEPWRIQWRPTSVRAERLGVPVSKGLDHPGAVAARDTDAGRRFLYWSRLPYFVAGVDGDSGLVHIGDARYTRGTAESWAAIRVRP